MKRVALYVRVSTMEQKRHGLSVDSQIVALKDFAKENGYFVQGVYNDAGISARKSYKKRPALLELCEDCEAGKVDLILFTKLDRWFRSVGDYYEVQKILDKTHVPWRAIWEDYETETSAGVFKVNIMLSVAQSEADRTSERIKAVNEYRRSQGAFVGGVAPIGYKIENKALVIDEEIKDKLRAVFDAYLATFSPAKTIEKASSLGLTISRPKLKRMMTSEVYAGNAYGYKCEPYISQEEHQLLLDSFEGRRQREKGTQSTYIFGGLLRCGTCGGTMSSHRNTCISHDKKYSYKTYKCSSHNDRRGCDFKKVVFESTLEKYLLSELDNIFSDAIIESKSKNKGADHTAQIRKLKAKLERIGDRYENGDISKQTYLQKSNSVKLEIQELEKLSEVREIHPLPDNWKETYSSLDEQHKKAFWHRELSQIIINPDKTFNVVLR